MPSVWKVLHDLAQIPRQLSRAKTKRRRHVVKAEHEALDLQKRRNVKPMAEILLPVLLEAPGVWMQMNVPTKKIRTSSSPRSGAGPADFPIFGRRVNEVLEPKWLRIDDDEFSDDAFEDFDEYDEYEYDDDDVLDEAPFP